MNRRHHEIRLPELGLDEIPITICSWLVDVGHSVVVGDRVLEVLAGEVTIDISAPATGVLAERRVEEDEPVNVGQVLGIVETQA